MADVEKAESGRSSSADNDDETIAAEDDATFQRIRTGASAGARSLRSLSRNRSNNGYGVDDLDSSDDSPSQEPEKDPFEVSFEGGDSDPMCPRSMSKLRKWVIVSIVSLASTCV